MKKWFKAALLIGMAVCMVLCNKKDVLAAEGAAVINLPSTDAYAKEIEYFANCVKEGKEADVIKPEELETVIEILNDLNK
mgnify:CR=1 FL=1